MLIDAPRHCCLKFASDGEREVMRATKAVRRLVSRWLIGAILFTQLAVAAYACPGLSPLPARPIASPLSGSSYGADACSADEPAATGNACQMLMDSDEANLCGEHCKYGQSASGHSQVPFIPTALRSAPHALVPQPQKARLSLGASASRPSPGAPASHAILHCSLLI